MFLNFTNQPAARWPKEQLAAAAEYGEITELAFPRVEPEADEAQIEALSEAYMKKIRDRIGPGDAVFIQGEFTLVYAMVTKLKAEGMIPVSVCMKREVIESEGPDGLSKKELHFRFVQFRRF